MNCREKATEVEENRKVTGGRIEALDKLLVSFMLLAPIGLLVRGKLPFRH